MHAVVPNFCDLTALPSSRRVRVVVVLIHHNAHMLIKPELDTLLKMMYLQGRFNRIMRQLHVVFVLLAFTVFAAEDQSGLIPSSIAHREQQSYFNLKIFWEQGFRWQGSTTERKWCMTCRSSKCSNGTGIKVSRCDKDDPRQQFYFDDRRIRSRKNKDMCLKRYGRYIALDDCSRSSDQVWSNLRTDAPFELQIPGNESKCASQHHHPKDGEKVYMNSCKLARSAHTDKWVVY